MLRKWHRLNDYPDPTANEDFKETLRGIKRTHGKPKRRAKALYLSDLQQLVMYCDEHPSLKNKRSKAALLVGYFGAFRRSELANHHWEWIEFVREGIIITLPHSKTDQEGKGLAAAIPIRPDALCPVQALLAWRDASRCHTGSIYRRLTKSGKVC